MFCLPSYTKTPMPRHRSFKTCGKDIEGITGQKLYDGLFYNQRLGRDEYLMPINYAMAKKVGAAQKNALKAGDCLKIVETFRPYEVQMLVKDAVYAKARIGQGNDDGAEQGRVEYRLVYCNVSFQPSARCGNGHDPAAHH